MSDHKDSERPPPDRNSLKIYKNTICIAPEAMFVCRFFLYLQMVSDKLLILK